VPAKAAWQVGSEVAEGVLERHHSENDEYPEEIGVVAWERRPYAPAARPSPKCSR